MGKIALIVGMVLSSGLLVTTSTSQEAQPLIQADHREGPEDPNLPVKTVKYNIETDMPEGPEDSSLSIRSVQIVQPDGVEGPEMTEEIEAVLNPILESSEQSITEKERSEIIEAIRVELLKN